MISNCNKAKVSFIWTAEIKFRFNIYVKAKLYSIEKNTSPCYDSKMIHRKISQTITVPSSEFILCGSFAIKINDANPRLSHKWHHSITSQTKSQRWFQIANFINFRVKLKYKRLKAWTFINYHNILTRILAIIELHSYIKYTLLLSCFFIFLFLFSNRFWWQWLCSY